MKSEFKWRDGYRARVDPSIAGKELQRIRDRDGMLQAKSVVDEARDEASPLHPAFEWDDEAAGERWRKQQAMQMLKSLVEVEIIGDRRESRPVYVHVQPVKGPGYYQSVEISIENVDEWTLALDEMARRLEAFTRSVEELAFLSKAKGPEAAALTRRTRSTVQAARDILERMRELR